MTKNGNNKQQDKNKCFFLAPDGRLPDHPTDHSTAHTDQDETGPHPETKPRQGRNLGPGPSWAPTVRAQVGPQCALPNGPYGPGHGFKGLKFDPITINVFLYAMDKFRFDRVCFRAKSIFFLIKVKSNTWTCTNMI